MFDSSLIETTEHLMVARGLHLVICGDAKTGYSAKVRGNVVDGGRLEWVTVSYYWRTDYETKAEATRFGRALMRATKHFRQASI